MKDQLYAEHKRLGRQVSRAWQDSRPAYAICSFSKPCSREELDRLIKSMEAREPTELLGQQLVVTKVGQRLGSDVVDIEARTLPAALPTKDSHEAHII